MKTARKIGIAVFAAMALVFAAIRLCRAPSAECVNEADASAGLPMSSATAASAARPPMRRATPGADRPTIRLASRSIDIASISQDEFWSATNFPPSSRGSYPFIVPFDSSLRSKKARRAIENAGARIISFLPPRAFSVDATPAEIEALHRVKGLGNSLPFRPVDKIAVPLAQRLANDSGTFDATIVPVADGDLDSVVGEIEKLGGRVLKYGGKCGSRVLAECNASTLKTLAGRGDVRWIEERLQRRLLNNLAVTAPALNVQAAWNRLGLSGHGQTVAICDSGIDTGNTNSIHGDFAGRIVGYRVLDGDGRDTDGHGTHTAGSLAGSGAMSGGLYKGVAYNANIFVQSWADNFFESMDELFSMGQDETPYCIHSDSWGSAGSSNGDLSYCGTYMLDCEDLDRYTWLHPELLPVFAAGNYASDIFNQSLNGASTVTIPATAKNALAVGAVGNINRNDGSAASSWNPKPSKLTYFSSQGPCSDGRVKPDVVAPGLSVLSCRSSLAPANNYWDICDQNYAYLGGTSMACPLTAGCAALVRQYLVEQAGFDKTPPTAALLKAILTGGAIDISTEAGNNLNNIPAPNKYEGWGRVNVADSLAPTNGSSVIFMDRIQYDELWNWRFDVEITNSAPLSIQLSWIDYPADPSYSYAIVNDLDLVAVSPSGREIWGNVGRFADELGDSEVGYDELNNLEGIRIEQPEIGTWTIYVQGANVPFGSGEGGAAALYLRGAIAPEATTEPIFDRYAFSIVRTGILSESNRQLWGPVTNVAYAGEVIWLPLYAGGGSYVQHPSECYDTRFGKCRVGIIAKTSLSTGNVSPLFDENGRMPATVCFTANDDVGLDYYYYQEQTHIASGVNIASWWFYRYLYGSALASGASTFQQILEADYDGDGSTNEKEYFADTDPTDPESKLEMLSMSDGRIVWKGGMESIQTIMHATSLAGPWAGVFTNAPPTPITNVYEFSAGGGQSGFFRVDATR